MNYTIIDNPYRDENSVITTRGVMTDAKIAKLNNATKRPAIVKNWEANIPQVVVTTMAPPVTKDYSKIISDLGMTAVNPAKEAANSGAKKLRVNKIVNEKASNIFNSVEKIDVIPEKVVELPKVEVKEEIKEKSPLDPVIVNSREELHGRHVHTGEIPVDAIKEAVKNDSIPSVNNNPPLSSRSERNAFASDLPKVEIKTEAKAGDMDLYNNLLHNVSMEEDVSKQLQGARNQLNIEKEENRKLAEQYGEAVKELEKLKEDINNKKKAQEQHAKEELSMTLKSIENIQKENLERTSDLTSIKSEIARLKAEKQAMEENFYEGSRSFGRTA